MLFRSAVGRLPLSGDALQNYVQALVTGWADARVDGTALVWAVEHDAADLTSQVKSMVTGPLSEALRQILEVRVVEGDYATVLGLLTALGQRQAGLVVTSSHGMSGPLGEQARLRATLGLPVDVQGSTVPLGGLVKNLPPGAVWFAQAGYSAGNDADSRYDGLVQTDSAIFEIVSAVAALGSSATPAARSLLGMPKPIRGMFGYVEPFFNWTLRIAQGERGFTDRLVEGILGIAQGKPLGLAFSDYYTSVGMLYQRWAMESNMPPDDSAALDALKLRLAAKTRQSLVLLGDPTAVLAMPDGGGMSATPGSAS